jgi:hypothetical protein
MTDDAEQVEIVKRLRVFRKRVNFRFQPFFDLMNGSVYAL